MVSRGILAEHFTDETCKKVYLYVNEHRRKYKSQPGFAAIKDHVPEWEFYSCNEDPLYLIDRFVVFIKRNKARNIIIELANAVDDPERSDKIDQELLEAARTLTTEIPQAEINTFSQMEERILQYEEQKKTGKLDTVRFGFKTLDESTGGIQPHELVTVSGFTGSGKSTLLMQLTRNAYAAGKRVLYLSLEMEAKAILRRLDAMTAPFNYNECKRFNLSDEDLNRYRDRAASVRNSENDIIVIDSIRNCTPDQVYAETVKHVPDLVVVDYLSLMRSSRPSTSNTADWQALGEVTQDLKQNARTLGIPVLVAAQTNRAGAKEGAELDNIGYSIRITQDSDILIGLHSDQEMNDRQEKQVRLRKNRDGPLKTFMCRWDYRNMDFREKGMME